MSPETESSMGTRPSLLARLKDWSQQTAWRQFDHDYAPLLRNVARKAGLTEVEADEVAQETLISVAKKIGEFEHAGRRGSFRAWLYQQARWRIADQFRVRAKARPLTSLVASASEAAEIESDSPTAGALRVEETAGTVSSESDPVFDRLWNAEWEEHVRQSALVRVKRQVSPRQFQLFELHVFQGLSVREAAKAAGTTMAAVYMAKSRVGRLFRKEMKSVNTIAK
jgi:RNA polymerase sigma factor (sigma-70 family)